MTVAAVGDAIISHRIGVHRADTRYARLAEIISAADISSVNLETSVFNLDGFDGWPAAERGGSYLLGPPGVLDDLSDLGFNMFARANNHAGDWGIAGLEATTRALDERGLHHCGVGGTMAAAARPAYLDTPNGRVATVSLTTTFPVSSVAGPQRPDIVGRPGCNGVALTRKLQLPGSSHDDVVEAMRAYGSPDVLRLANLDLVSGNVPGIIEEPSSEDVDRIMGEIEKAAAFSDLVLVNGHTHEPANAVVDPPGWLVDFARACVDAGAHAYLGHGPHQLRPAEIYRGRPIFYSLGNFICHRDTADPVPGEQYGLFGLDSQTARPDQYVAARDGSGDRLGMTQRQYYESVIAEMEFMGGELTSLIFHPVELGLEMSPGRRGVPRLAVGDQASEILGRLAGLSAPFGLKLEIDNGQAHARGL